MTKQNGEKNEFKVLATRLIGSSQGFSINQLKQKRLLRKIGQSISIMVGVHLELVESVPVKA